MGRLALLVMILVGLGLIGTGQYGVLDNNEGLYAEVAREMVESGDWLAPRLNYVPYLDKPPLLYWSLAVSLSLFGTTEVAVRLVPAAYLAGTLMAVGWLAVRLGRPRASWTSVVALGTATGFVVFFHTTLFDVPMTCFMTWSLACLVLWLERPDRRDLRWGFWGCLGLAVLSKGPVALALAGLIVLAVILVRRLPWPLVRRLLHPSGLALFLLIAVPWHAWMCWREPGYAWFYFINEHVLRFLGERQPGDYFIGPWYYYLERLPLYLGIGFLFLPLIVRRAGRLGAPTPVRLFLWCWVLVPAVFFTLARAKANYYLLPAIPAWALLFGLAHDSGLDEGGRKWALGGAVLMLLLPVAALVAIQGTLQDVGDVAEIWQAASKPLLLLAIGLLVLSAAATVEAIRRRRYPAAVVAAAVFALAPMPLVLDVMRIKNEELSQRSMALWLKAQPPAPILLFQDYEKIASLQFYLQRPLPVIECASHDLDFAFRTYPDSAAFMTRDQARTKGRQGPVYVVCRRRVLDKAREALGSDFRIAAEFYKAVVLTPVRDPDKATAVVREPQDLF